MTVRRAAPTAAGRRWTAPLAWALAGLALLLLVPAMRLGLLLAAADLPETQGSTAATVAAYGTVVLALVSSAIVGAVLASRRPRHPVGWLLLGVGLSIALSVLVESYTKYGLLVPAGSLPGARYLVGFAVVTFTVIWLSCAGFVLLLTPTGSLPSPRWRWWARIVAAAAGVWLLGSIVDPAPLRPEFPDVGNPLAVPALFGPLNALPVAALLVLAGLPVGAVSLLLRFRRARGVERQQLRWLVLAAALAAAVLAATLLALALGLVGSTGDEVLLGWMSAVVLGLMPLATGAAILRYRLYDLDRIVSRTVAYGLLTVLLGGGYAVVVLGLGQLLGRDSTLVVAGATLAVAAVFQPARRRVQGAVDRRFNRRRYDAARTIQGFSTRLREQVDLDALTAELLVVADQTMQPTRVSIWLRPRGR